MSFNSKNRIKCAACILLLVILVNMFGAAFLFPLRVSAMIPIANPFKKAWDIIKKVWDQINKGVDWVFDALGVSAKTREWIEKMWAKAWNVAMQSLRKRLLDMLVNDIINWIQGGGNPRFITNFGGFLRDAADAAGGDMINRLTETDMCKPFAPKLQFLFGIPPDQRFDEYVQCKFSDAVNNIKGFADNFNNGGWKSWIELSTTNSDFYGAAIQTSIERTRVEKNAETSSRVEAASGAGFLGSKVCVLYTDPDATYNFISPDGVITEYPDLEEFTDEGMTEEEVVDYGFECKRWQTRTPGQTLAAASNLSISSDYDWLVNNKEAAAYIAAILDAVVSRAMKEGLAVMQSGTGARTTAYYGNYEYQGEPPVNSIDTNRISAAASLSGEPIIIDELLLSYQNVIGGEQSDRNTTIIPQLIEIKENMTNVASDIINKDLSILSTLTEYYSEPELCSLPSYAEAVYDSGSIERTYTPSSCEGDSSACSKIEQTQDVEITASGEIYDIGFLKIRQFITTIYPEPLSALERAGMTPEELEEAQRPTVTAEVVEVLEQKSTMEESGYFTQLVNEIDTLKTLPERITAAQQPLRDYKDAVEEYNRLNGTNAAEDALNRALSLRDNAINAAAAVIRSNSGSFGEIRDQTRAQINDLTQKLQEDQNRLGNASIPPSLRNESQVKTANAEEALSKLIECQQ